MKALITIIGTGPGKRTTGKPSREYRKSAYQLPDPEGTVSACVPFCFFPLAEWLKPDAIHVYGTKESMWPAILDFLGRRHGMDEEEREALWVEADDCIGTEKITGFIEKLERRVNRMELPYEYFFHLHGYLEDGDAQWTFFHDLSTIARAADTVYLDFTHGFRHVPLFIFTAMTYIRSLYDRPDLGGMYYGALEMKADSRNEAEPARIIDLMAAWDMTRWFHATRDFQKFGNGRDLSDLLARDAPEAARRLRNVDLSLEMNCAVGLDRKIGNLNRAVKGMPDDRRRPYADLKAVIHKNFEEWEGRSTEWQKQVCQAFWYYHRRSYMQALSILREAFITRFLEENGHDIYALRLRLMPDNESLRKEFTRWLGKKSVGALYRSIRHARNNLDHGFLNNRNAGPAVKSTEDAIRKIFTNPVLKSWLTARESAVVRGGEVRI